LAVTQFPVQLVSPYAWDIPPPAGYPSAQGKYRNIPRRTIPTVSPYRFGTVGHFWSKRICPESCFCFRENKSSARMYVCILYQVESQYIANSCKSTLEGPQTQLPHGIRCFTRHHQPQDGQIIRSYSADILRPSIRTGWVLEMSPSDHYWRRYVVGQWLVFLMVLEL
jgi:hypothetical protein